MFLLYIIASSKNWSKDNTKKTNIKLITSLCSNLWLYVLIHTFISNNPSNSSKLNCSIQQSIFAIQILKKLFLSRYFSVFSSTQS